jgi:hypothetical protein
MNGSEKSEANARAQNEIRCVGLIVKRQETRARPVAELMVAWTAELGF